MMQDLILISMWIVFSLLHSLLATNWWKTKMFKYLKSHYKYYRVFYSVFALFTFSVIIIYNFSIQSILLWQVNAIEKIIAFVVMICTASVMLIFTKRFFFDLSGADAFKRNQVSRQFINTNLYKYVRHPLYSATIIFVWSVFLWKPVLSNLITCICITIYTLIGILLEEKKLISEFGESYTAYQLTTPMLIPRFNLNKPVD